MFYVVSCIIFNFSYLLFDSERRVCVYDIYIYTYYILGERPLIISRALSCAGQAFIFKRMSVIGWVFPFSEGIFFVEKNKNSSVVDDVMWKYEILVDVNSFHMKYHSYTVYSREF